MLISVLAMAGSLFCQNPFANVPIVYGNPFREHVSFVHCKLNNNYTEPIKVNEDPLSEATVKTNELASWLTSKGLLDENRANQLQNRIKISTKVGKIYHDMKCDDISGNFYNLPAKQQVEENFYNKLITRTSVLVQATRDGDNVHIVAKRVHGQTRKRLSGMNKKSDIYSEMCERVEKYCHYQPESKMDCGMKPVSSYKCQGYPVKCGYVTEQQFKCETVTKQVYKCDEHKVPDLKSQWRDLFKFEFRDNWSVEELNNINNDIEARMLPLLHL